MKQSLWQKFKQFYQASPENKTQITVFLGCVIIPAVGMTILYICVNIFLL